VLPSTQLWPATSTIAPPSVKLELSESASRDARAKADEVGNVPPSDVDRLADLLLASANTDDAPTIEMHPFLHEMTARKVAACVPSRVAEVLLRDIAAVKSMHDFRAWCWQCYWAVGNRAELRRTTN